MSMAIFVLIYILGGAWTVKLALDDDYVRSDFWGCFFSFLIWWLACLFILLGKGMRQK